MMPSASILCTSIFYRLGIADGRNGNGLLQSLLRWREASLSDPLKQVIARSDEADRSGSDSPANDEIDIPNCAQLVFVALGRR
jgi:hypothetical protein